MRHVDGYLSKLAQKTWPTAIVTFGKNTSERDERSGYDYQLVIEKGEEPIGLGDNFRSARNAIAAVARTEDVPEQRGLLRERR